MHTIGNGYSPVLGKWSAPYSKVEDLHDEPVDDHVATDNLNGQLLFQTEGEFVVHEEKAYLASPYRCNHRLFDDENEF